MKRLIYILNIYFFITTSAFASDVFLQDVYSENTNAGTKVYLVLDKPSEASMFFYEGDRPRVVCDFGDINIRPGLSFETMRLDKTIIYKVRLAKHETPRPKLRVVLDLVLGMEYDVKALPMTANRFSVIIKRKTGSLSGTRKSSPEVKLTIPGGVTQEPVYKKQENTYYKTEEENTYYKTEEETPKQETPQKNYQETQENYQETPQENYQETPQENYQETPQEIPQTIEESQILDEPKDEQPTEESTEEFEDEMPSEQYKDKWPKFTTQGKIKMVAHMEIDEQGFAAIKGYVVNKSDEFYYSIVLEFDLFNNKEDLVGNLLCTLYNIKPSDRKKFVYYISEPSVMKFRISESNFW